MNFFELRNIAERGQELVNPTSPEKVIKIGEVLGLTAGNRVIEFGSGYGEVLALWAGRFGNSGIGIDVRQSACDRATKKMIGRGLADRIQIVCADAAAYQFDAGAFDVAACIGASFIWKGYRSALQNMKRALRLGGKIAIGEPYWRTANVPPDYSRNEPDVYTEYELLQIAREEGFDFEYVVRASHDDWDHYEAENWRGWTRWIEENPNHPERNEVIGELRKSQNEYTRFGREYLGWAIYVLNPIE